MFSKIAGLSAAAVLTATTAMASTSATATTDLNLRNLPDVRGEILTVIPGDADVTVDECVSDGSWCKVTFDGTQGWAYSPYLTATVESQPVVIYQNVAKLDVKTVDVNKADREKAAAIGGLGAGALAMSVIGGPLAVAGAAAMGAIAGAESVPEKTVTYVTANPMQTVYVDGEVVVGAGIPTGVELAAIPDSDYRYVYLNGTPVLVDADRTIVRIIR